MSYQPPPPDPQQPYGWHQPTSAPYGTPQHPPAYVAPAPPKKTSPGKIVLLVVGGVLVVCCGGGAVAAMTGDGSKPEAATAKTVEPEVVRTEATRTGEPVPLSSPEDLKPKSAKMPDVRGQNAKVAQDYLQKLGFTNISLGSQDELDQWVVLPENWTVKKQSMKAGRRVPTDTLIVLTCTKLE